MALGLLATVCPWPSTPTCSTVRSPASRPVVAVQVAVALATVIGVTLGVLTYPTVAAADTGALPADIARDWLEQHGIL